MDAVAAPREVGVGGDAVGRGRGAVRLAYAYDWTTNASDSTSDYDATATRSEYSWLLAGGWLTVGVGVVEVREDADINQFPADSRG